MSFWPRKMAAYSICSYIIFLTCFEGGGCGVGIGLGWGFGTAFGSQYRSSRVTFEGIEFSKEHEKDMGKGTKTVPTSK